MVEEQTEDIKNGKESFEIELQLETKLSNNDNHRNVQIDETESTFNEENTEIQIQSKIKKKYTNESKLFLRRERDRVRQRLARQNEDEEKRKLRLEKDRIRKRLSRQLEDDFERLRRRDKDRERRALKRKIEKEKLQENNSIENISDERVSIVNNEAKLSTQDYNTDVMRADSGNTECTVQNTGDNNILEYLSDKGAFNDNLESNNQNYTSVKETIE